MAALVSTALQQVNTDQFESFPFVISDETWRTAIPITNKNDDPLYHVHSNLLRPGGVFLYVDRGNFINKPEEWEMQFWPVPDIYDRHDFCQ